MKDTELSTRARRRREALLKAGAEVFAEHGLEAASLDMVIARAGGSRRSIYQYFRNKEGLFRAAVEALLESTRAPLSMLQTPSGNPRLDLVDAGTAFVAALLRPEAVAAFRMVLAEATRFPDLARSLYRQGPEPAYAQLASYLAREQAAGRLMVEDPALAARILVEAMKGHWHLAALLGLQEAPDPAVLRAHVAAAVDMFMTAPAVRA